MITDHTIVSEDASPNPEFLIKSIAEQGYSFETSLADLMDNSISANANRIEVMVDMESEPFCLFLADNGKGMNEKELRENMQFPSSSPDQKRDVKDLGRFGLGLKTASFSQTRNFTVLSRRKGGGKFHGRTWDVNYLREHGWKIIVNTEDEINSLLAKHQKISSECLNAFDDMEANTVVIWNGLYKFESYLNDDNKEIALKKEITEITTDYLSLVFHRFMERTKDPLQIRINNSRIKAFNPFPEDEKDFRPIEFKQTKFRADVIKIEGFVLPSRCISESKKGISKWTTKQRGLMDMEGIYVYRADRVILFGGWNGLIKKAPRLQLARLRVEVGNGVDHLLHLNVAKSQIEVPYELRLAFERYIDELKVEAEREYFNRGIRKFSGSKGKTNIQLFERKASNKGVLLELNNSFPLINNLKNGLSKEQLTNLNLLLRMINTRINDIRNSHEDKEFSGIEEKDGLSLDEIRQCIEQLLNSSVAKEIIKEDILPNLGFNVKSFPSEILDLIK